MWWKKPSNDRDWSPDQMVLPSATFEGPLIYIRNIRNCRYFSKNVYDVAYYDKKVDLRTLKRLWFVLEPFSRYPGPAHTLVSFEFSNGGFIAVSVEIRKKKGDTFSALKGCLREMELMYVIGDEHDLIGLRANIRRDTVYVYPVKAGVPFLQQLFVDVLERANRLHVKPEFYNTFTNSCTGNLRHHINTIAPRSIPLSYHLLLPLRSDAFLQRLGYIDSNLPLEELRERFRINERALCCADSPDFSRLIRPKEWRERQPRVPLAQASAN